MSEFEPGQLLRDLFTRLRQGGFHLGVGELLAALQAVEGGFGAKDAEDLKDVARLLWCYPPNSEDVFDTIWALMIDDDKEDDDKQQEPSISRPGESDPPGSISDGPVSPRLES